MPSSSSAPCTVPSSPWRPCSAMKTRAKPSRLSSASSRSAGSKAWASTPCDCSAASTPLPDISDTGRSALLPPISTATLPRPAGRHWFIAPPPPARPAARHPPMEPAPMVITTSPPRAAARDRLGQRRHVVDEHDVDPAGQAQRPRQRAAVGADDRRFAGGIDLGQQHGVEALQHGLDEVVEAVARARVAVRLEGQHQAPPREGAARRGQHGGHLRRVVAVVVDQRERPAVARAAARHGAGSGGRRPRTRPARAARRRRATPAPSPRRSLPARCARCARRPGSASPAGRARTPCRAAR